MANSNTDKRTILLYLVIFLIVGYFTWDYYNSKLNAKKGEYRKDSVSYFKDSRVTLFHIEQEIKIYNDISTRYFQDCDVLRNGKCLQILISDELINYFRATSICEYNNSTISDIDNELTYIEVMKKARSKMPAEMLSISLWTGSKWDAKMEKFIESPLINFVGHGHRQLGQTNLNNVYLVVDRDETMTRQGIAIEMPLATLSGVICQKQMMGT